MIIEKVYFSATDGIELLGLLHKSDSEIGEKASKSVLLSVHGMTSSCTKKREDLFAQEFTSNGIDYFCFNNRGMGIITYFDKMKENKLVGRIEAGSAKENFLDSYHDVKGALEMLIKRGYETIYLQGHSYGSSKSVYTYYQLKQNGEADILKHIKAVSLLSIIDIPRTCRALLGDKFDNVIEEVSDMVKAGNGDDLIKREYFLHPISAHNFMFCSEIGGAGDLAPFGEKAPSFTAINSIDCGLFMRWGKERDMILQSPEELEKIIKENIKNKNLNVGFVEGTGHNYHFKERETAKEFIDFIFAYNAC